MRMFRKGLAVAASSAFLVGATAMPAQAQQDVEQNGVVNIVVGDIEILNNVDVDAVVLVGIVANVCDTADVGPIAAAVFGRATAVDNSGRDQTICTARDGGPVTIIQD